MAIPVSVDGEIRLDSFLKWARISSTGGQSKMFIQSGLVSVNGAVETRRGRMLRNNDLIKVEDAGVYIVCFKNE
ncbi:MAG: ribosome-associated protein [Pelotomaculum sp. PtaB.Bin104]|nr:MAG: ribosome-associated protein [Pelotomaculum sp. PtaB.Bin104]